MPFASNRQDGATEGRSYREVMIEKELEREEERVQRKIEEKLKNGEGDTVEYQALLKERESSVDTSDKENAPDGRRRKRRWDVSTADSASAVLEDGKTEEPKKRSRWDETPVPGGAMVGETPRRSRWDQAPALVAATPVGNQGLVTPMHPSSVQACASITLWSRLWTKCSIFR